MTSTPAARPALPADLDLTGRTALVTGCGSAEGIGFATARALAERGAHVAMTATTDRIDERASELRELGFQAHGVVARLESLFTHAPPSLPGDVQKLLDELVDEGLLLRAP